MLHIRHHPESLARTDDLAAVPDMLAFPAQPRYSEIFPDNWFWPNSSQADRNVVPPYNLERWLSLIPRTCANTYNTRDEANRFHDTPEGKELDLMDMQGVTGATRWGSSGLAEEEAASQRDVSIGRAAYLGGQTGTAERLTEYPLAEATDGNRREING